MKLFLSSDKIFHTIEGEGPSAGTPVVFMRLSMCNLTCRGFASPENPDGCDSTISWKIKNPFTYEELLALYKEKAYDRFIRRGDIWKLTGGEPMIQQKALLEFLELYLEAHGPFIRPNIEIETNATIMPDIGWDQHSPRFICSPKLSNNGDPWAKRYVEEVLQHHADRASYFKFVLTSPTDIVEIMEQYVDKFAIEPLMVYLMPEGTTTQRLKETGPMVAEVCKEYGFNFSPRLQVYLWEQVLGR